MLHWRETPEWQLPIYISIVDMGYLWKFAAPSTEDREKNDLFPFTWKGCSSKLFHMIPMRHRRVKLLILVNDPYDLDLCIEDSEHHKHNVKKPYICEKKNIAIRATDALPSSKDFNDLSKNKSNKIPLQQFLKAQFTAEAKTF